MIFQRHNTFRKESQITPCSGPASDSGLWTKCWRSRHLGSSLSIHSLWRQKIKSRSQDTVCLGRIQELWGNGCFHGDLRKKTGGQKMCWQNLGAVTDRVMPSRSMRTKQMWKPQHAVMYSVTRESSDICMTYQRADVEATTRKMGVVGLRLLGAHFCRSARHTVGVGF